MNTVTIIPVRGNALYRRYSGQNAPQDCYVSLDRQKGYSTADFYARSATPSRSPSTTATSSGGASRTQGGRGERALAEIAPLAEL